MYTLMKNLTVKELAIHQAPAFFGALAIAEMLYKFGSFLLEAIAFVATWFILDALITGAKYLARAGERQSG